MPERNTAPSDLVPATPTYAVPGDADVEATNPWTMVDDRMRGRWRWAIVLGVVLALAFAAAGYFFAPVGYTSRGLVDVQLYIEPLLDETNDTGRLPDGEAFVGTQVEKMKTERVLSMAWDEPKFAEAREKLPDPPTYNEFAESIAVSAGRRSNLIFVEYTAPTPTIAKLGVDAVLDTYIRMDPAAEEFTAKRNELVTLREQTRTLLMDLQRQRSQFIASSQYAKGVLDEARYMLFQAQQRAEGQLAEVDATLAQLEALETPAALEDGGQPEAAPAPEAELTDEPTEQELDEFDPTLAQFRTRVRNLEQTVALYREQYGSEARPLQQAEQQLALARADFEAREQETLQLYLAANPERAVPMDAERLRERREELLADIAETEENLVNLENERGRLQELDTQINNVNANLQEINERIDDLDYNAERLRRGRVGIFSRGFVPTFPEKDRRMQAAAAGGAGGLGLGLGIFFLLGTLDRRAYAATQLRSFGEPGQFLGVLPELNPDGGDAETTDLASQCVHRIRNRIEINRRPGDGYVAVVSSPFQGDGKTSLALALGWSYATSGCRTLLVDCDFIGRSLTHQTGRVNRPGVKEVLQTHLVNGEITPLDRANLSVLGIGKSAAVGPQTVRKSDFERLFNELRKNFDVIIVDTGPLLASVEAMPVVAASDGVVLALARGRSRSRLSEAIEEIKGVGASYLGVVLNRADRADCERYTSVSRLSTWIDSDDGRGTRISKPNDNALVRALESAPVEDEEELGDADQANHEHAAGR